MFLALTVEFSMIPAGLLSVIEALIEHFLFSKKMYYLLLEFYFQYTIMTAIVID